MKLKYEKREDCWSSIEFAPEETFGIDDKRIKCIERPSNQSCEDCFFRDGCCEGLLCSKRDRQDKRDVLFVNDTKRENARNEQNKVVVEEKEFRFY